ncbi:hypothetical protein ACFLSQ_11255, partial [Bacteroidota bacterium]
SIPSLNLSFSSLSSFIASTRKSTYFETLICESVALDTITIDNVCSDTLFIFNAEITGDNKDEFSIVSPAPASNIYIESKQSMNFIISFEPGKIGIIQAELTIESNDTIRSTYTLDISRKKDSVGFEFSVDTLKFEHITEDNLAIRTVDIINTGNIPLEWPNVIIVDQDFELISISPNPTMPFGESSVARILFNGGKDGYIVSGDLELTEEFCNSKRILTLYANVGDESEQSYAILKIDSIQGKHKPGEIVTVPIILYEYGNLESFVGSMFSFDLESNATILRPVLGTEIEQVINGQRIISLLFKVNPDDNNILKTIYLKSSFRK